MIVFKEFRFEAAHSLPHLGPDHKCARRHGHSYLVRVEVKGEVGEDGMVVDYARVSKVFRKRVFDRLDHRDINTVMKPYSTSENLAVWIWERMWSRLPGLHAVEVRETPTAGARYEGP